MLFNTRDVVLCKSGVYFVLSLYCSSSSPVPGHRDCKEQIRTQFGSFPSITSRAVTVLNVFIHTMFVYAVYIGAMFLFFSMLLGFINLHCDLLPLTV